MGEELEEQQIEEQEHPSMDDIDLEYFTGTPADSLQTEEQRQRAADRAWVRRSRLQQDPNYYQNLASEYSNKLMQDEINRRIQARVDAIDTFRRTGPVLLAADRRFAPAAIAWGAMNAGYDAFRDPSHVASDLYEPFVALGLGEAIGLAGDKLIIPAAKAGFNRFAGTEFGQAVVNGGKAAFNWAKEYPYEAAMTAIDPVLAIISPAARYLQKRFVGPVVYRATSLYDRVAANPIVEQMGRLSTKAEEATIGRFHNWADEGLQKHVTDKITEWGERTPATAQPTVTFTNGPDGNKVMTVISTAPSELQQFGNLYSDMTGEVFKGNLTEAEATTINKLTREYIDNGFQNYDQWALLNELRSYMNDEDAYNFVDKLTAHHYTPKTNGVNYHDPRNWPYIFGNWRFRKEGSAKAKQEGTYLFIDDPKAEAIRKKMYHKWNPVASWLLGNKQASLDAAEEGIDRSIEIFKRKYPYLSPDLGVGGDYMKDFSFSALPSDQHGFILSPNDAGVTYPYNGYTTINLNHYRSIKDFAPTSVHEANHLFTLDPTLKAKYSHLFGFKRVDPYLDVAYPVKVERIPKSKTVHERSAENATIRHMLGLSDEEIKNLPTERFIRIEPSGHIRTIYEDIMKKDIEGYLPDYDYALREELNSLIQQNIQQGGNGLSDVFPTFAKDFSDAMKDALINSYKTGGKL